MSMSSVVLIGSIPTIGQAEATADGSNGVSSGPNGVPAGSGDAPTTSVTFRTQHGVAYGETIKVVGDSAYLGAWEIAAAPGAASIDSISCNSD
jgi:hypothetical protein